MIVKNNGKYPLIFQDARTAKTWALAVGEKKDVPVRIAERFMKFGAVEDTKAEKPTVKKESKKEDIVKDDFYSTFE